MLDHTVLLGAIPQRFGFDPDALSLAQTFELARGNRAQPAMEMTKWFDTNYHYLVPELGPETPFAGGPGRLFGEVEEARALGLRVKPVLIGPVTYLRLSKSAAAGFNRLGLLPALVAAYVRILHRLRDMGVDWVQLDEPALCTDLEPEWLDAYDRAYGEIAEAGVQVLMATYFGSTADYADRIARLPLAGVHIDAVRAPETLESWRQLLPRDWVLSAGVIDGRNVWRNDLRATLGKLRPLHHALGDRLWIAPSCSLSHVPVSLEGEEGIGKAIKPWLAFAAEKLEELSVLGRGLALGDDAIGERLEASDAAVRARRTSKRAVNALVRREAALASEVATRSRHARRCNGRRLAFRYCRRRRSARSRRRNRSGRRDRLIAGASSRRWSTCGACARKSKRPCGGRKSSGSTCSFTAKPSATTWLSSLPRTSGVSPSPATAGSRATARAASSRRSSTATYRGRSR
jgi:5-methyltetrahydropteroyltriglutamate--homocysteine methyltransferase